MEETAACSCPTPVRRRITRFFSFHHVSDHVLHINPLLQQSWARSQSWPFLWPCYCSVHVHILGQTMRPEAVERELARNGVLTRLYVLWWTVQALTGRSACSDGPYRLPLQKLPTCEILAIPAAPAADCMLLNVHNRPSSLKPYMAGRDNTPVDPCFLPGDDPFGNVKRSDCSRHKNVVPDSTFLSFSLTLLLLLPFPARPANIPIIGNCQPGDKYIYTHNKYQPIPNCLYSYTQNLSK